MKTRFALFLKSLSLLLVCRLTFKIMMMHHAVYLLPQQSWTEKVIKSPDKKLALLSLLLGVFP